MRSLFSLIALTAAVLVTGPAPYAPSAGPEGPCYQIVIIEGKDGTPQMVTIRVPCGSGSGFEMPGPDSMFD